MILENEVVQKLKLSKNNLNKECALKLVFIIEVRFWHFLANCQPLNSQSTVVSFDYIYFMHAKPIVF